MKRIISLGKDKTTGKELYFKFKNEKEYKEYLKLLNIEIENKNKKNVLEKPKNRLFQ